MAGFTGLSCRLAIITSGREARYLAQVGCQVKMIIEGDGAYGDARQNVEKADGYKNSHGDEEELGLLSHIHSGGCFEKRQQPFGRLNPALLV